MNTYSILAHEARGKRQEARDGGNTSSGGTSLNGMHICPYFQQIHTVIVNENVHVSVRRNTSKSVCARFYFYSVCPVMFFFFGEGWGRFLTDHYVIDSKRCLLRGRHFFEHLQYFTLIAVCTMTSFYYTTRIL